jgi:hypothetical protein
MRALATTVAILGVVGAIAIGNSSPVQAADQNHQDRHYNSNGGRWCPPDWTVEGGMCKPHRRSPWDWYREQA